MRRLPFVGDVDYDPLNTDVQAEYETSQGEDNGDSEWMPISPGDKSFEYPCPICDADVHEFCTSRDKDGIKIEHHTEVHWSRCEVADGNR